MGAGAPPLVGGLEVGRARGDGHLARRAAQVDGADAVAAGLALSEGREEGRLVPRRLDACGLLGGELDGAVLEPLGAVVGLGGEEGLEAEEGRQALLVGHGDHALGGGVGGEAHDGLVDRADLLHVERAVGQPLAHALLVREGHQPLQDAVDAAVRDGQDDGWLPRPAALQEGEGVGVEELAAAALDPAVVAPVDEAEHGEELAPAAAALVHRVGVARGGVLQPGEEGRDGVARLPERARALVARGGQEVPVLRVEQEDQAHERGEEALVELRGVVVGERLDALGVGAVEPAQELVERAQDLAGEPLGHLVLRLARGLEERAQAKVGGPDVEAPRAEGDLEAAEHRAALGAAERGQGPGHPARRLAARGVEEAQRVAGDQDADLDARLAHQALEPLVRRGLPALLGTPLVGVEVGA